VELNCLLKTQIRANRLTGSIRIDAWSMLARLKWIALRFST